MKPETTSPDKELKKGNGDEKINTRKKRALASVLRGQYLRHRFFTPSALTALLSAEERTTLDRM